MQDRETAESVARKIVACKGQKALFILDGWDELPRSLQEHFFLHSLTEPQEQDAALGRAAVIMTSHPISSSQELHKLMSSRVEIIGFTLEARAEAVLQ